MSDAIFASIGAAGSQPSLSGSAGPNCLASASPAAERVCHASTTVIAS